jgi:hypothetical protein
MTREQIEQLRNNADTLLAMALEALEMREALEWMASEQVLAAELVKVRDGLYEFDFQVIAGEPSTTIGSTPLEAIQKAMGRR